MNERTVITISREYGSGGRELSQILAKKLGVKLYDRQIISLAAQDVGVEDMKFDKLKKFEEEVPALPVKFMPFYLFGVKAGPQTLNDKLFDSESEIIRRLADSGPCVILGRCADYVLRRRKNTYSFYICANDEFRAKRGQDVYEGRSLTELNEEDLKRGGYYSHYTGRKWGDPKYYNLSINTSYLSLEAAADLIIHYVESLQAAEQAK